MRVKLHWRLLGQISLALTLPPHTLVAALSDRLDVLTGGPRDLPETQRSLRATIAWSYDLLPEDVRRAFRRLAVFVDGWTLSAARAVCAPGDALHALDALVGSSLVRPPDPSDTMGRFAMLDTLRDYALERLAESGEGDDARRLHASYYAELPGWPDASLAMGDGEAASAETGNLRVALMWALDQRDVEKGLRLVAALGPYWSVNGASNEARSWIRRVADLVGGAPSAGEHGLPGAEALRRAGQVALALHEDAAAVTLLDRGVTAYQAADGARRDIALALTKQATATVFRDDNWRDARALYKKAIELSREDDRSGQGVARVYGDAAWVAWERVEIGRAILLGCAALRLYRSAGDANGLADTLYLLALVRDERGEGERAIPLLIESLNVYRRTGDRRRTLMILVRLAVLTAAAGRFGEAAAACKECIEFIDDKRDGTDWWGSAEVGIALEILAGIALVGGQPIQATHLYAAIAERIDPDAAPSPFSDDLMIMAPTDIGDATGAFVSAGAAISLARVRAYLETTYADIIAAHGGPDVLDQAWQKGRALLPTDVIDEARAVEPAD